MKFGEMHIELIRANCEYIEKEIKLSTQKILHNIKINKWFYTKIFKFSVKRLKANKNMLNEFQSKVNEQHETLANVQRDYSNLIQIESSDPEKYRNISIIKERMKDFIDNKFGTWTTEIPKVYRHFP